MITTDGEVFAVARDGNTVYIGGEFSWAGPRTGPFAALGRTTAKADLVWPEVTGGSVDVAIPDGNGGWDIGGGFTHVAGRSYPHLGPHRRESPARRTLPAGSGRNGDGARPLGWNALGRRQLQHLGGKGRHHIAALNPATGDALVDVQADGTVLALGAKDGVVYAGGSFFHIGGKLRNRIAAINAHGKATSWNSNADQFIGSLAVSGNTVHAAGAFTFIGGQGRNTLAAINRTTGAATDWNPSPDSSVVGLAVSSDLVYVWGFFMNVGGESRSRLAALDLESGNATSWDPSPNGLVLTAAPIGSTVIVGGGFTIIGGQERLSVAAVDAGGTGTTTSWNPGANETVRTIDAHGGTIFLGGDFSAAGISERQNAAAFNASTGAVTAWNPSANASVEDLAVGDDGTVYAGGFFDSIGGQARNFIAALEPLRGDATTRKAVAVIAADTGDAQSAHPDPDGIVFRIAPTENTLYVAGGFANLGDQMRPNIGEFSALTSTAMRRPGIRRRTRRCFRLHTRGRSSTSAGAGR